MFKITMKSLGLIVFISLSSLSAREIRFTSEVPLGISFDGRVLWVTDVKDKILYGYDFDTNKYRKARALKLSGIRDVEFWRQYLIGVYKKNIWFINPINGDIVDKISLSKIVDPVAIAIDGNMAYIYDRKSKLFYRYDIVKREYFGTFSVDVKSVFGATFNRSALWVVDKDKRAVKIEKTTGESLKSVPLPTGSLGITFINGELYVSTAERVTTIDFIQSEYYIAASKQRFNLNGTMTLKPTWSGLQKKQENRFELKFYGLSFGPHQRYRRFKTSPEKIRPKKRGHGDSLIQFSFDQYDKSKIFNFKTSLTMFSVTYIFNRKMISTYFKKKTLPRDTLMYTKTENYPSQMKKKVENLISKWKSLLTGKHPYQLQKFLIDRKIQSIDEQVLFYRLRGLPARKVMVYNLIKKKFNNIFQIYIQPVGWVPVSKSYQKKRPREFPISNNIFEVFYFDSVEMRPEPQGKQKAIEKAVKFSNFITELVKPE